MEDLSGNVKDIEYFRAKRLGSAKTTSKLVCLNFKVPLQVRHEFKIHAALHDMTMTELLLRLLDDCIRSGREITPSRNDLYSKEIKK